MGCSQGKSAVATDVSTGAIGITTMANEISMQELQQVVGESMGETVMYE